MKKLLLISALTMLSFVSSAQQKVIDAFQDSYAQEKLGNYVGAAMSISSVYDQNNYEHNLRLGYLKYMCGAYSEASTYYLRAIELMPFAIEPKIGYTLPLIAMGNWNNVVDQYVLILKIDPSNTLINYKLGYIYYTRKNYEEAYQYFDKIVKLYPFDYDGLVMLAWTSLKLGKMDDAKLYFNRALLNSPNDKSIKEGLGLIK